jgi:hypothetical protein
MVRFVAMQTNTSEILPVEVAEGQEYDEDEVFNYRKHKSHLLTCIPRRMDWNKVRRKFKDLENIDMMLALDEKNLLK